MILKELFKPFIDEVNSIPKNFNKAICGKRKGGI